MILNILNNIMDEINIFVGFLCIVIAVTQTLSPSKKSLKYILIMFYSFYSVIILFFYLEASGKIVNFPYLIGVSWPFHSFIVAVFYLYINSVVTPNFKLIKKHFLFFIPGFMYILILIPTVFFQSLPVKMSYIYDIEQTFSIITNFLFFIVPFFIYIFLVFKKLRPFIRVIVV